MAVFSAAFPRSANGAFAAAVAKASSAAAQAPRAMTSAGL
jgi:hypothetical protein